ncbi:uncharacterized protein LOC132800778 [Ziziphus jujuba]|uniref:Uncharacterized protein LOC132800778 n=1 Tax=Ziziphus jujuba TaxID=326968 RepID=A0ABM4A2S9_ZIZJJ|nr:uncharacterized protein LOC132800778 [Ziziphus jujuba]
MAHTQSDETSSTSKSIPTVPIQSKPTYMVKAIHGQTLIAFNVASQAPLKLTDSTYFPWHAQFDSLRNAYDLYGYLDGFTPYNLLLNALQASLTPKISHLVSGAKTSAEVWTKLATQFAKLSRSHIMSLRQRLIKQQGHRSVLEYLLDIKTAANELALLHMPVIDEDLILYVLNGLALDFKDISTAFRTRDNSVSFDDLHE